jgi:L-threonylcarbamoyladenylate synthase
MALVAIAPLVCGARSGKIVSFPTDTVPALGVIPAMAEVIYTLKQRSPDKPLILMGASLEELWQYVDTSDPAFSLWQELAQAKLPGALTLVLPQNPAYPPFNVGFTTIGIRVPNHPRAIAILRQTAPLLTTSANLSGKIALLTAAQISAQFPKVLVLDDLNIPDKDISGVASTVVEYTETGWVIKRQGAVNI